MENTQEKQPELHWYAMKVFYNRVFEMEDLLDAYGIETYLACENVQQKGKDHSAAAKRLADESNVRARRMFFKNGPIIYKRVPMVSSLIFFRADEARATMVSGMLTDEVNGTCKGFIYSKGKDKGFSVIRDSQMEMFRLVTSSGANGLDFIDAEKIVGFRTGEKVRVTEGPFAGAEGYIKRIGKDRRLLVCIEGVIAVATSYIPKQMLEKVEE